MNLVKDDLVGVADAPETGDEGQHRDDNKCNLVVALIVDLGLLLGALSEPLNLGFGRRDGRVGLLGDVPLPQGALRRLAARHGGLAERSAQRKESMDGVFGMPDQKGNAVRQCCQRTGVEGPEQLLGASQRPPGHKVPKLMQGKVR